MNCCTRPLNDAVFAIVKPLLSSASIDKSSSESWTPPLVGCGAGGLVWLFSRSADKKREKKSPLRIYVLKINCFAILHWTHQHHRLYPLVLVLVEPRDEYLPPCYLNWNSNHWQSLAILQECGDSRRETRQGDIKIIRWADMPQSAWTNPQRFHKLTKKNKSDIFRF